MAAVSRDGRGQILLVAGFALAVTFVALALVLNSAIYTENLATRNDDVGAAEAVEFRAVAVDGTAGVMEYVNYHNNTSHADLNENLTAGVSDWSLHSARSDTVNGRWTNVTVVSTTDGTRIEQANASRNFTNESGTTDWTLVGSVGNVRAFEMNVSDDNLLDTGALLDDRYYVEVDNGVDQWTMYVYEDTVGADIIVEVENASGGGGTCTASSVDSVWVNLTAGTVGGQECQYLSFAEGVGGSYDIEYHNADKVSGTYTLVVDNSTLAGSPTSHYDTAGGSPFVTHAVYSTQVRITYESAQLRYVTVERVAPGEADD